MAEKKTTTKKAAPKAAAEKKVAAPKAAEKKVAVKAVAEKKTAPKAAAKKVATKVAAVAINAENVGFKAGDVYQALAKAEKALTVAEIAKAAKIATEEVYLGIGWLFKEGKVTAENNAIALA